MRGWKKYMENEVKTSNPAKITIMAYEKCILDLKFSKDKMENLRFSEADKRLENVERIINELSLQINREVFPELADDLYSLYGWILNELEVIRIRRDAKKIDPIVLVIQNLLDGYREALKNHEQNN